jgi:hypothetical protein
VRSQVCTETHLKCCGFLEVSHWMRVKQLTADVRLNSVNLSYHDHLSFDSCYSSNWSKATNRNWFIIWQSLQLSVLTTEKLQTVNTWQQQIAIQGILTMWVAVWTHTNSNWVSYRVSKCTKTFIRCTLVINKQLNHQSINLQWNWFLTCRNTNYQNSEFKNIHCYHGLSSSWILIA